MVYICMLLPLSACPLWVRKYSKIAVFHVSVDEEGAQLDGSLSLDVFSILRSIVSNLYMDACV